MDTILQAIVVGIVQGVTEFLPVSSSAHLILVPRVLGWDNAFILSPAFDATLHLGTLVALIAYFWRDLWRYLVAFLRLLRDRAIAGDVDKKIALLLAISIIPGAILGVGLESFVDTFFREQLLVVCALLVVGAAILFFAERVARHTREMDELRPVEALAIGLAQALALFPGISRSGITISAGLFLGLKREDAARFSFLMATPIIAGAGLWKLRELVGGSAGTFDGAALAAGLIAAAISGLIAIWFLLAYLRRASTDVFGLYRVGAAIVFGVLLLAR
ncbi:MAG: undecaprenyl-diphosphatase [Chloroflexota bacterium]|jgi:undecaprenyl-diphosphatase|nr:undecaprenyl-diphosphatase [Chloroflexota bacterium]